MTTEDKEKFLEDIREVLRKNNVTRLYIHSDEIHFGGYPYKRETIVVEVNNRNLIDLGNYIGNV